MKNAASLILLVLVLAATPAHAQARQRGFLTGLGVSLFAVGLTGAGLGIAGLTMANESTLHLSASFAMPLPAEQATAYRAMSDRAAAGTTLAVGAFVGAGVAVVAGLLCVLFDGAAAPVQVAFAPTARGGQLVLALRF